MESNAIHKIKQRAYYNEFDKHAAAKLRKLINAGLIAPGDVDERSIEDVTPNDLRGYTQCHFFAGIGVWSHALRTAGWGDSRPVWTGSCPCQPFSQAGEGEAFDDERHLWPAWHHLIRVCKPTVIFGEQVASKAALGWLDLVQSDLEGEGYSCGATDLCAAGVRAPHIRQRLYYVSHPSCTGLQGLEQDNRIPVATFATQPEHSDPFALAWSTLAGDFSSLLQRDGLTVAVERLKLKGYGNALCAPVAIEFIKAYMEVVE